MKSLPSFWVRRSTGEVLATFPLPGKGVGPCLCVSGERSSQATGGVGVCLEMGVSTSRSFRHTVHLLGAFWAFPATPLDGRLINVGGGMYGPYAVL